MFLILGSSMVERSTVNRAVESSNLSLGVFLHRTYPFFIKSDETRTRTIFSTEPKSALSTNSNTLFYPSFLQPGLYYRFLSWFSIQDKSSFFSPKYAGSNLISCSDLSSYVYIILFPVSLCIRDACTPFS